MARRFPPPWKVERIEGGYKVLDANGQALAYVYGQTGDVSVAKTLTLDEARRIASNIAKLPELLGAKAGVSLALRYFGDRVTSVVAPDPNAVAPAPVAA